MSETNSAVDLVFAFTGKFYDEVTGLQNNLNRWYDAKLGQWLSEDPIGFAAGDANVRRYVGNGASSNLDIDGLQVSQQQSSNPDLPLGWSVTLPRFEAPGRDGKMHFFLWDYRENRWRHGGIIDDDEPMPPEQAVPKIKKITGRIEVNPAIPTIDGQGEVEFVPPSYLESLLLRLKVGYGPSHGWSAGPSVIMNPKSKYLPTLEFFLQLRKGEDPRAGIRRNHNQ